MGYTLTAHDLAVLDHICSPRTDEARAAAVESHRRLLAAARVEQADLLRQADARDRQIVLRSEALRRLGEDPDECV